MSDNKSEGHFNPLHAAHAIEQVVFVVQMATPLSPNDFLEVRSSAEQFKNELPGRAEIQGFAFAIGGPGPKGPIPSGPSIGSVFHRVAPDGSVESELRIEHASVTFRISAYTRWEAVWKGVRKYFDVLLPKYVAQSKISAISMSYIDKFVWIGDAAECRPELVLRKESKYLCPTIFDSRDLWHSHTGAFLRTDEHTKRLLNINVDCLDEAVPDGPRRVISIGTVLTDLLNQPGYKATEIASENANEFIDLHMQQLHNFGKTTFGDVINDNMGKRIALID